MKYIIKIITLFYICNMPVLASQTVFNVPSADVTEEKAIFLQTESQFRPYNPDAFWLGTNYTAYGIGHNTEIDATLYNVQSPGRHNISLGLGFKTAMPIAKLKEKYPEQEFKFTVGSQVLVGLQDNGVGNWSYAHLSGRLPKTKTRITSGISVGTKQVFERNAVAYIMAVEQPVTKKLNIIADWYSGDEHFTGFLIAGISYKLPKDSTLYLGYQIPNTQKNGRSGFVVELSKIFK